jgi:geranylgeranyl pyrophosphate synthase
MTVGCAIEMIHCYSLIHDDLPAMDDDDMRRGRATNHKVFGDAHAILAGDGLLTLAFELLANEDIANALAIIAHVSQSAGPQGMVGGQALDMVFENKPCTLAELETIHQNKTGALLRTSVICGGYIAKANDETLENLNVFSTQLGLAFQIADDVLDVTQSSSTLGKNAGSDTAKNKATYPALMGLEKAIDRKNQHYQQAIVALDRIDADTQHLKTLANFIIQRTS